MATVENVLRQVEEVVSYLIEVGLSSDQNFVFRRQAEAEVIDLTFNNADVVSVAMKNRAYVEIYDALASARAFVVKMPDGALLQMMYRFSDGKLLQHRLAFFPSPHLEEFQNNPEIYLEDELYADIVAKNVVPFPIRFDYDARDGVHKELSHPISHLSLGQYEQCRIPVSAAITPYRFIDFILRNFYNTAFRKYADGIPVFNEVFADCILAAEHEVVHVRVPVARA